VYATLAYHLEVLLIEDALWMVATAFVTKYYTSLIAMNWDKSLHVNFARRRHNKG
jgi:hypothetical protein